jgi:hypothetical protein
VSDIRLRRRHIVIVIILHHASGTPRRALVPPLARLERGSDFLRRRPHSRSKLKAAPHVGADRLRGSARRWQRLAAQDAGGSHHVLKLSPRLLPCVRLVLQAPKACTSAHHLTAQLLRRHPLERAAAVDRHVFHSITDGETSVRKEGARKTKGSARKEADAHPIR